MLHLKRSSTWNIAATSDLSININGFLCQMTISICCFHKWKGLSSVLVFNSTITRFSSVTSVMFILTFQSKKNKFFLFIHFQLVSLFEQTALHDTTLWWYQNTDTEISALFLIPHWSGWSFLLWRTGSHKISSFTVHYKLLNLRGYF